MSVLRFKPPELCLKLSILLALVAFRAYKNTLCGWKATATFITDRHVLAKTVCEQDLYVTLPFYIGWRSIYISDFSGCWSTLNKLNIWVCAEYRGIE
jgi:hypothetical protein